MLAEIVEVEKVLEPLRPLGRLKVLKLLKLLVSVVKLAVVLISVGDTGRIVSMMSDDVEEGAGSEVCAPALLAVLGVV